MTHLAFTGHALLSYADLAAMTMDERHALGIYDLDLDYPDFDQCRFEEMDFGPIPSIDLDSIPF